MNKKNQSAADESKRIEAQALSDEALDDVAGGRLSLLGDDPVCEHCGTKKKKCSDPCPNFFCPGNQSEAK